MKKVIFWSLNAFDNFFNHTLYEPFVEFFIRDEVLYDTLSEPAYKFCCWVNITVHNWAYPEDKF